MWTLTKVSSMLTPGPSLARHWYSSIKSCCNWIDENAAQWWYGEQRVFLPADLTGSTSITLADVTGLGFPLLANTKYLFKFSLLYTSATAATGISVGLTCPASPTVFIASVDIYGRSAATGSNSGVISGWISASGGMVTSDAVTANATFSKAEVEGEIWNVNAGNLQLQWAAETASAGLVVPKAGSNGQLKIM